MIDGIVIIFPVKKITINVRYCTTIDKLIDFEIFIIKKIVMDFCAVYIRISNICGVFFVFTHLIRGPPFYQFRLKDLD